MNKIRVLSRAVYNRIAAGEVVDRPYSVVKELVENSIDAGATDIEIYVEKGGKELIKVVDNGSGIYKEDLPAAFLPHATSKISYVKDLDKITTLGFRGEALASISAIAKVEIISVTEGNPAYKINCEGGVVGEVEPAALGKGTVISVRDLFFNTPVRAKFLKSDSKEEADITNFVSRFILGNPTICFKFFINGKIELQSYGGGLEEAVAQVYGAKVIPQCFNISAEKDGVIINGFIGNQNFFKPTKNYQSVFLNGRYIVNNTIATAISNSYSSYAMKRQFPFYVLNIQVPNELVDVNVHPNKADVRFVDNRFIFGVIYKVISAILDGTTDAASFVVNSGRVPEIKSTKEDKVPEMKETNRVLFIPQDTNENNQAISVSPDTNKDNQITSVSPDTNENNQVTSVPQENKGNNQVASIPQELIEKYMPQTYMGPPESILNVPGPPIDREPLIYDDVDDWPLFQFFQADSQLKRYSMPIYVKSYSELADDSLENRNTGAAKNKDQQGKINLKNCEYKTSLFNTYLLFEHEDVVYIVDQHAAHERIIYDNLCKSMNSRNSAKQNLYPPYFFKLSLSELSILDEWMDYLNEMGFAVSRYLQHLVRVDSIPAALYGINLKDFFNEIINIGDNGHNVQLTDVLKERLAKVACKHAIKGGHVLKNIEVVELINQMDGDVGLKCPHGRPVCVKLTKREIETMFRRC